MASSKIIKPESPKIITDLTSSYIPLDVNAAIDQHGEIIQPGESSGIAELDKYFKWMRGFVSGWYGWANAGKGVFTDYMMVVKALRSRWKFCLYKPEDMDTVVSDGKVTIKANRIYYNLAWTLTGKTWSADYAQRNKVPAMTMDELMEALDFITAHFYVIHPKDRRFPALMDESMFIYEKYGVDGFMWDPWNAVKLPRTAGMRDDELYVDSFMNVKEAALLTNSSWNIITHPKSQSEVKNKDGSYKVVTQHLVLGGAAWDMKMDTQYSVYRQNAHNDPDDPWMELYNLKQKQKEIVGAKKGVYSKIEFDETRRQYYFNNINPITGEPKGYESDVDIFANNKKITPISDELPF